LGLLQFVPDFIWKLTLIEELQKALTALSRPWWHRQMLQCSPPLLTFMRRAAFLWC